MINVNSLHRDLAANELAEWQLPLSELIADRLRDGVHGDLRSWQDTVAAIDPQLPVSELRDHLLALSPWRKGPFDVAGMHIDAEWRSDKKWERLCQHWSALDGRKILDVGCGNGYYARRMREAGAEFVLGVDPSLLFIAQFAALQKLDHRQGIHIVPARLEDLPGASQVFDTTFSMGVLYHRRDPHAHLHQLHRTLKRNGELVLETLILPGDGDDILEPEKRYARMRNVWHLPTLSVLQAWLQDSGFVDINVVDVTRTSSDEQRTTEWMPFESLGDALDPEDASLTIEGLPAPTRAALIAVAA